MTKKEYEDIQSISVNISYINYRRLGDQPSLDVVGGKYLLAQ